MLLYCTLFLQSDGGEEFLARLSFIVHVLYFSCCLVSQFSTELFFLNICSLDNFNVLYRIILHAGHILFNQSQGGLSDAQISSCQLCWAHLSQVPIDFEKSQSISRSPDQFLRSLDQF